MPSYLCASRPACAQKDERFLAEPPRSPLQKNALQKLGHGLHCFTILGLTSVGLLLIQEDARSENYLSVVPYKTHHRQHHNRCSKSSAGSRCRLPKSHLFNLRRRHDHYLSTISQSIMLGHSANDRLDGELEYQHHNLHTYTKRPHAVPMPGQ